PPGPPLPTPRLGLERAAAVAEPWHELIGAYMDSARLLGVQTADLHRILGSNRADPAFVPEPFGKQYQRSLYQSLRNLTGKLCDRLSRHRIRFSEPEGTLADEIIRREDSILQRFRAVLDPSFVGRRIRCHGDFRLGQLLFTGKDFVIIDFEGDTRRTIGERCVKRSPFRDVASMILSLDYAVQNVLLGVTDARGRPPGMIRAEDRMALQPWGDFWYDHVVRQFYISYIQAMKP